MKKKFLGILTLIALFIFSACATTSNKLKSCNKRGIAIAGAKLAALIDSQKKSGSIVTQGNIDAQVEIVVDRVKACNDFNDCDLSEDVLALVSQIEVCKEKGDACNKYIIALDAIDLVDTINACYENPGAG